MMTKIQEKFFQLLRLGIGITEDIPNIEQGEWAVLYSMAKKQSLTALVFDGVQKAGKDANIDGALLLKWMGESVMTEKRNLRVNEAVAKATAWFQRNGYRACVLKGQGNALMYPNPLRRTPGDIDLWVEGKPSDIIRFVHKVVPKAKASYHHIDFPPVDGVPVEVHYRPCYMQNLLHNHRLQQYFLEYADEQFSHYVEISGAKVTVPTGSFNVVFQLVHIYNHLFQEGIGMRQLIDYYLLIHNSECIIHNCALQRELKQLGLWTFAGAVMWVLHETLGLPKSMMIALMDEKRGMLLLNEILEGGNFGQHSGRQHYDRGSLGHNIQRIQRDLLLVRYYPAEALAEPFFRTWHFLWRLKNKK